MRPHEETAHYSHPTGFSADLLVSSLVFWIFAFAESRRLSLARPWIYVLINLVIGLSFALPLFLFFRERRLNH